MPVVSSTQLMFKVTLCDRIMMGADQIHNNLILANQNVIQEESELSLASGLCGGHRLYLALGCCGILRYVCTAVKSPQLPPWHLTWTCGSQAKGLFNCKVGGS